MRRPNLMRRAAALLPVLLVVAGSVGATWPPEKFNNLKVLPKDISQQDLIDMMAGFTRALGVRCTHCHVGEAGMRFSEYDFESDEKDTKRKAREMIRMVSDLNDKYLGALDHRADPPLRIECATCHRGATVPRMLEDVLLHTYETVGPDSALAQYHRLRSDHYGRFAYDFGSVPLTDVAAKLETDRHEDDALRFLELNVEKNPQSVFAKRQHAALAVSWAFRTRGAEAGTDTYRTLHGRYGADAFPQFTLNQLGYEFLREDKVDLAITVFGLNAEAFPRSANAFDSLGEAYLKHGDRELAVRSYRKSLDLDATNDNARRQLEALGASAKQ